MVLFTLSQMQDRQCSDSTVLPPLPGSKGENVHGISIWQLPGEVQSTIEVVRGLHKLALITADQQH